MFSTNQNAEIVACILLFIILPKNFICIAGKRYEKSKQTVTILGSEQEIIDYMILPRKMKKGS